VHNFQHMQAIVMQQLGISTQVPQPKMTTKNHIHIHTRTHTHTHTGCRRVEGAGAEKAICFLGDGNYDIQLDVLLHSLRVPSVIHQACVRACVNVCLRACVRARERERGKGGGSRKDLNDACAMPAGAGGGEEPDPRCTRPLHQGPLKEATPVPHSAPACLHAVCALAL
jgi:hypothetical protein